MTEEELVEIMHKVQGARLPDGCIVLMGICFHANSSHSVPATGICHSQGVGKLATTQFILHFTEEMLQKARMDTARGGWSWQKPNEN